jgi:hypothetical protein
MEKFRKRNEHKICNGLKNVKRREEKKGYDSHSAIFTRGIYV